MKNYDAVIIGAGPAGLNAGLRLTSFGLPLSVLLIDKIIPWETPIPCAEGVGRLGFEEAILVDPSWIRLIISKAKFYSPDGACVTYTDANKGFIIDRAKMQRDMAGKLAERGAEIKLGVKAKSVSPVDCSGVRKITLGDEGVITARVVVDASGPVSLLGRGEAICWKPYDLEPAYFAVADNVQCDDDAIHIYSGQKIAPGGYVWVFPRGGGGATIGVVVGKNHVKGVNIRDLLSEFIDKRFPDAEIRAYFAGSIPCGYRRGNIALPGLIKCGDAANATNPISRAGIVEALMSGALAGSAAFDMLSAPGVKQAKKICRDYEKAWLEKRGARHLKLAKAKESLAKVPDEDYNVAAKTLQKMSADKISMAKIFGVSLARFPRLAWALRHLM
jgi:geranylgeranyl reductase family protein